SNHPPEFIYLPQSVLVPEKSLGPVLTVISRDFDEGDDITVHWAWEDVEAATYFYFNESEVTIDYEHLKHTLNMTSFPLLLTLDDGAMTSQTRRTQISVIDENEAPTFLQKVLFLSCDEGKDISCYLMLSHDTSCYLRISHVISRYLVLFVK
ncbi:hypothetical protein PoB_006876300, partial [Plakobranchus ocellatus]